MFKINPFLPPRTSLTTTQLYDLENQGQVFKTHKYGRYTDSTSFS